MELKKLIQAYKNIIKLLYIFVEAQQEFLEWAIWIGKNTISYIIEYYIV